jgi:hypothetical protein
MNRQGSILELFADAMILPWLLGVILSYTMRGGIHLPIAVAMFLLMVRIVRDQPV